VRQLTCWTHARPSRFAGTSVLAGLVGDIFGRRNTLFAGAAIFTLGGLFQTCATGIEVMIVGRIISGFGVGFLS
jgi:MFS family permease